MRLALGTVQFGLSYGIANQGGQVSRDEASGIVALARDSGIDTLDTAIAYGESEACLGAIGTQGFRIITKLPAVPSDVGDVKAWVYEQVQGSLKRLKVTSVYALLLHRPQDAFAPSGRALCQALEALRTEGLVGRVGVSIYSPSELDRITQSLAMDVVQAPLNVLDQRLLTSGWLPKLKQHVIEVHTRSAFLQGLLLMPREALPSQFSLWQDVWHRWHDWLQSSSISAAEACLGFAKANPLIDRVVVGVETRCQLQELLQAFDKAPALDLPDIGCEDERLINPSLWRQS